MIPAVFHTVWPGRDEFRSTFHGWRQSWMKHHPDASFLFHRLDVPSGCSERARVANVLARTDLTVVVKSDVLRYAVVEALGGVYVDADYECLAPVDAMLQSPRGMAFSDCVTCLDPAFFAAQAHHPVMQSLLWYALDAVESTPADRCNRTPNEVTGPRLCSRVLAGKPIDLFKPGVYGHHHCNGATPLGWVHHQNFGESAKPKKNDDAFLSWYTGDEGSGAGSQLEYTKGYRAFLERFMADHGIESVLDIGCGDWQFSRLVDWGSRSYLGVDVVPHLIERLRAQHGGPLRRFECINSETWEPPDDVDLVICKDVLQHLPSDYVLSLLRRLRAKHVLLTNDLPPNGVNGDCERGGYRPLDLSRGPFNLSGSIVYRFPKGSWEKVTFHTTGDA
jgi:hypothetical protein